MEDYAQIHRKMQWEGSFPFYVTLPKGPPCLSDTTLLFSGIFPLLSSDSQKHPCSLSLFPTTPQVQLSSSLPYHLGGAPMLFNWTSAIQSKQSANKIHILCYFVVPTIKKVLALTSWAGHTFSRLEGLKTITPSSDAAICKRRVSQMLLLGSQACLHL